MTAKNGSIPSRSKKRFNLKFVTDRQTDRRAEIQTESTTKNNRLLG